jgi:hypothetical protein
MSYDDGTEIEYHLLSHICGKDISDDRLVPKCEELTVQAPSKSFISLITLQWMGTRV